MTESTNKYKKYTIQHSGHKIDRTPRRVIKCHKPRNKAIIQEIQDYVDNVLEQGLEKEYFFDTEVVENTNTVGILELKDFYHDLESQIGFHRAREEMIFGEQTQRTINRIAKYMDLGALFYATQVDTFDPLDKIFDAFMEYHKKYRGAKYKAVAIPLWTKTKTYYYKFAE